MNKNIELLTAASIEQDEAEKHPYERPFTDDNPKSVVKRFLCCSPHLSKVIVNLDDEIVLENDLKMFNPNLRATCGRYMIKYLSKKSKKYKEGRPFFIGQDLIRMRINVAGYKGWKMYCRKIPELAWIDRNSILTPFLFMLAKMHPGVSFYFTIDWTRYGRMLMNKGTARGYVYDPENGTNLIRPFVNRRASYEEYYEKYQFFEETKQRLKIDVLKEINEAERDPDFIKEKEIESGKVSGKDIRGRDKKTGRFVSMKKINEMMKEENPELEQEIGLRMNIDMDWWKGKKAAPETEHMTGKDYDV